MVNERAAEVLSEASRLSGGQVKVKMVGQPVLGLAIRGLARTGCGLQQHLGNKEPSGSGHTKLVWLAQAGGRDVSIQLV